MSQTPRTFNTLASERRNATLADKAQGSKFFSFALANGALFAMTGLALIAESLGF